MARRQHGTKPTDRPAREVAGETPGEVTPVDAAEIEVIVKDLNERQREAACHGEEPLLIVAGAGTGKTMTLAHRVAYLIASGVAPERILLLTFTRRAAAEMLQRVDGIVRRARAEGGDGSRLKAASGKVWGGTFHAVAARLLRLHGRSVGLDPAFTILDRSDSEDLLNVARTELGLAKTDRRFPQKGTCLDIYSRCVNLQSKLEVVLEGSFPWCAEHRDDLKSLFDAYVAAKERQAVLDYDDLLLFWRAVLADEKTGKAIRERFDRALVDEYQDTNPVQADIVELLRPGGGGVTVVGDDAQAIYSFRAATVRNILDFPERFPGVRVVALEQNYRSVQPILDATNALIDQATERHTKNLWTRRPEGASPELVTCQDEDEQTSYLIERILERREEGLELKRQAVLFRAAHHSLNLELELARRHIPFRKYGGLKFSETAHVKDLMAFLRLAENPRDAVAATRVLLLLPGIGPKKAQGLIEAAAGPEGLNAWLDLQPGGVSAKLWTEFAGLLAHLAGEDESLGSQLHAVRRFYGPLLEMRFPDADARLRDLAQIEQLAGRFSDRGRFLAELALDPPSWTEDLAGPPGLDEDYLILSTMHSAKGLEWDAVYVIHAADGNIPSDMSCGSPEEIEEELRLFYVACTRARDRLTVCFPFRYYKHPHTTDRHGYAQLTRFVSPRVKEFFEERTARPAVESEDAAGQSSGADVTTRSIRDSIADMWS
ncbi:MAG: ATP-dependent helicase [Actinobacteria bacterium]|nr:MAG: ATP-dependent helicase [Actinomycetota bacterium]